MLKYCAFFYFTTLNQRAVVPLFFIQGCDKLTKYNALLPCGRMHQDLLRKCLVTVHDSPSKLFQKELYVALPVTAPRLAGFLLTVCTEKPPGPVTSTSTT